MMWGVLNKIDDCEISKKVKQIMGWDENSTI